VQLIKHIFSFGFFIILNAAYADDQFTLHTIQPAYGIAKPGQGTSNSGTLKTEYDIEKSDAAAVKPDAAEPVTIIPIKAKPVALKQIKVKPVKVKPVKTNPVKVKPVEVKQITVKPVKVKSAKGKLVEVKTVEEKSGEAKPVEVKPYEKQLVDEKPVEVKPAEVKPTEVKPLEVILPEIKPAEVKPVEEKPVAGQSVEVKPEAAIVKSDQSTTEPAYILINAQDIPMKLINDDGADNLWQHMRAEFVMQDVNDPLIIKHEKWYADHPDYVARMMSRANRYLYYINAEVERRGMPGEIALLPMIESAFNPTAYSSGNAAGIWQFIPSTGKHFGLRQNWWYDGRRDIVGATTSALNYLEKLHSMFGDWQLALAAYNWGEGSVKRAQERNRKKGLPVDYANLTLPDETRNYLPKLLAIKNVVANPDRFGLTLPAISNEPYFTAISTDKDMDVKLIAQLADISPEEFKALNPAHNRPVMLQDNSDVILLPVNKVETFQTNLENYDKPLVSWQAYHAKKGERLDSLAPRFGLSVEKLKTINGLSAHSRLSNGLTLLVPMAADAGKDDTELESFNMHLAPVDSPRTRTEYLKHIVRKGETPGSIARHYHVSVTQLNKWNAHLHRIKVGQTLSIAQTNVLVTAHKAGTRKASKLTTRKADKKHHAKASHHSKARHRSK
jgi:membrane-bound lytic murein transglycosylase D